MKIVFLAFAACLVLGVGAFLVIESTEGDRAASARQTLERAANEFVECYEQSSSYEKCETGTSKIAVTLRRRREFSLTSSVELGPSYTISRRGDGRLRRSCQPEGSHCPVAEWAQS